MQSGITSGMPRLMGDSANQSPKTPSVTKKTKSGFSLSGADDNGTTATLNSLNDAMDMLGTDSSECMATFALSVSCDFERKGGKIVADSSKYLFSIKYHNVFHIASTQWHGPPQVASVGYAVTNDMLMKAQPLSKPAVMDKKRIQLGTPVRGSEMDCKSWMS